MSEEKCLCKRFKTVKKVKGKRIVVACRKCGKKRRVK